MRVSNYIIGALLDSQPFYLLLHGFSGAVDKVPAALGQFLVQHRGLDLDDGDIATLALSPATLSQLTSRGYLTDLDFESERQVLITIATMLHNSDLEHNPARFMFVPTYTCNLRCPYCFQSHDMHAGTGEFGTIITPQRIEQAFAVIDQFTSRGSLAETLGMVNSAGSGQANNHTGDITLFGGEPLSELSLPAVRYILKQANRRGRALSAITNGVQLALFADMLGPGLIEELQITLDGLAELHDRRRISPEFRHTFDTIVANIDMALNRGVRIKVRMNIDATNIANVKELDAYFAERGWHGDAHFMAYAAVVDDPRSKKTITRDQLVEHTVLLNQQCGSHIESYELYARDTLTSCLRSDGYPFKSVANCAAESGLLIFDPLGDVYSCWDEVGERQHRVATYGKDGIAFETATISQWLTRFPGSIEQCSVCPYALIHKSGCANHARSSSGTMFASACESFQEFFPRTVAKAYQELEAALFDPTLYTRGRPTPVRRDVTFISLQEL